MHTHTQAHELLANMRDHLVAVVAKQLTGTEADTDKLDLHRCMLTHKCGPVIWRQPADA